MRRVHRETVDVLARFGRDGRLEPCVVVLKDCRAFRIDEVLMASARRASTFAWVAGKRSCSWSISWKTPPQERRINMYGGCALSMEQSEVPPKAAADLRVGCASGLALRALLAADGRRGWQRSATRAAPSSGTAHSLATTMLSAAADAGRGIVYGAVGPRVALWRCGARAAQDFTSA